MINKGLLLGELIINSGHWILNHDGVWQTSDDVAVQAIIDAYPLTGTKAEVIAGIYKKAMELREKVTLSIAPAEMASWPIKRAEALAYQANSNAEIPFLIAEASARGVVASVIVAKVLNNAAILSALEAQISGNAGKHSDAINAITSSSSTDGGFSAVLSYDWSTGWPSV